MTGSFFILAIMTLLGAIGAMNLGRLVYCALSLVVCFLGLAGLYLQLNAQFVGFVQVLVYVGAVAILIMFAMLLTKNADTERQNEESKGFVIGAGVAGLVFIVFAAAILKSATRGQVANAGAEAPVKQIGMALMETYVIPLEALALLLTAALIGAVVVAQYTGKGSRRRS